jgi:hypothetical protein
MPLLRRYEKGVSKWVNALCQEKRKGVWGKNGKQICMVRISEVKDNETRGSLTTPTP